MANSMTYELDGALGGHGWASQLRKAWSDYRLFRRTLGELQALNDRELLDLGLSRASIRDVAHSSVYGA
jgi:uncharacterized protein YjiS (DUF1127 family)